MDDDEVLKFWAYRHVDGHIHVKRYLGQYALDDAYASPFVDKVYEPFVAPDRREAERMALLYFNEE